MKTGPIPTHRIELRIRQPAQLFNSMDPTPFLNRDLDPEAEAFIESWAQEFPPGGRFHITIHLEEPPQEADPNTLATEAIHNFFRYKAELTRHQLNQLLRHGRASHAIGFTFVAVCLFAADAVGKFATGNFSTILRESLTIVAWVAMWRPMQIFLYDWWPLALFAQIVQACPAFRVARAARRGATRVLGRPTALHYATSALPRRARTPARSPRVRRWLDALRSRKDPA